MHKHGKCLWSVKNTFCKAGLSGILLYSWKMETPWSRAKLRFFKMEMMTLLGSMFLNTPTKPRKYSTILVFCQQMAIPHFLFSRTQVTKGKLWCLSGPADFLHFYLNIQLCFFPVPSGPWKLFLIRLCGSKEADPRFIGPVGEPLWQKQFKVTNAKLSADLWKGFL